MLDSLRRSPANPRRCALTSSTPDALWASRSVRLLRPSAVEIHGLRAADAHAGARLQGLDLSVPVGARLLLVSRPEATASLVLRVLAGLVRPAAGRFALAGMTGAESGSGWEARVGYVAPNPVIYPWLAPREALSTAARLSGLDRFEAELRVDREIERFDLSAVARQPMSRTGPMVAQKVSLAAALLSRPEVLLLDEPLRSVDPDQRRRLLAFGDKRMTVVMASRYPASEAGLVNQVALIRDGRLAMHGTMAELTAAALPLTARGIEMLADRRSLPPGSARAARPPRAE